ncbi:hypothetical protein, partial [Streptomyces phytophilus]|uniref:hypothetical protein n=1 Tax=Streptomyces phytophilus TaxID=722715 RepID=UPI0015EFFB26
MGEHVYELLAAAILGAIAVLTIGAYAGLWVMRRRIIDTQRQLQNERDERIHAVGELRARIVRNEYEREIAALDDGDDGEPSPEERRKRFRALPPPLAIPIALLLGAGAWLRTHLWAPTRAHPWAAAGTLATAAAVATAVYVLPGA